MPEDIDDMCLSAVWVLAQLWNVAGRYFRGGDYVQSIITAATLADPGNRKRLMGAHPAIVSAVVIYKEADNGVEILRGMADSWLIANEMWEPCARCGVQYLPNSPGLCQEHRMCAMCHSTDSAIPLPPLDPAPSCRYCTCCGDRIACGPECPLAGCPCGED